MTVKGKGGQPAFDYCYETNKELADEIFQAIMTSTESLRKIVARNPHFPSPETLRVWVIKDEKFAVLYARAKMKQAELMAEEIIEISDYMGDDEYIDEHGKVKVNHENINRARLRVDSRKWIACKLAPRIYGDKVINENHNYNHEQSIKDLE